MMLKQARLLALPSLRTMRWPALLGVGAAAAGLLTLPGPSGVLLLLAAAVLAAGVGFVFDDPAEATVASVPTSLLARRLLRVALALPLVVGLWVLLVWYGGADASQPTLVLAALAALAAAVGARFGGVAGAAVPPALLVCAFALPERIGLLGAGSATTTRWLVLLGVGIAAFCAACRDPALGWRVTWT